MMGFSGMGSAGIFGTLIALVIHVDLILVSIWLWQQISKK